jgi:hypothetical protein
VNSGRRYLLLAWILFVPEDGVGALFLNKMFLKRIFWPQIKGTGKIKKFVMRIFTMFEKYFYGLKVR